MERPFDGEIEGPNPGDGEVRRGDGILASTNVQFRGEDTPAGVPNRFTRPTREPASVR